MITVVGWDVGGANVKAAWLAFERGVTQEVKVTARPYEIWRNKDRLPSVLKAVFSEVAPELPQAMALTMTAELADVFSTKREGVNFVLAQMMAAFPECDSFALSLSGEFFSIGDAQAQPLNFAASNWLATALYMSELYPNSLLMDVGSTTTDIIPILDGQVASLGFTDLDRLKAGELVYTGALRTNLATIVHAIPVRGQVCPVSSEYFSISGDVHLILGHLSSADYDCPTPDGRPPTVESAQQRLARLVCADTEMLSPEELEEMALYIYRRQLGQIDGALQLLLSRMPNLRGFPVVVMGAGAFLAKEVARRAGLTVVELEAQWGRQASEVAPCVAVAYLLAKQMERT